jgi:hypothetical protein
VYKKQYGGREVSDETKRMLRSHIYPRPYVRSLVTSPYNAFQNAGPYTPVTGTLLQRSGEIYEKGQMDYEQLGMR